jgi:hypothetical protein
MLPDASELASDLSAGIEYIIPQRRTTSTAPASPNS